MKANDFSSDKVRTPQPETIRPAAPQIDGRRVYIAALIFMVALPAVCAGLQFYLSKIYGDTVRETAYDILNYVHDALGALSLYVSAALLAVTFAATRTSGTAGDKDQPATKGRAEVSRGMIAAMYAFSVIISNVVGVISSAALTEDFADYWVFYALYSAGAALFEAASGVIAAIVATKLARRSSRLYASPFRPFANPLATSFFVFCGVTLVFSLVNEAYSTASFFASYSDPTSGEIVSIVTAYLRIAVTAVVGYFAAVLTAFEVKRRTAAAETAVSVKH